MADQWTSAVARRPWCQIYPRLGPAFLRGPSGRSPRPLTGPGTDNNNSDKLVMQSHRTAFVHGTVKTCLKQSKKKKLEKKTKTGKLVLGSLKACAEPGHRF